MSEYGHYTTKDKSIPLLSHDSVKEAKEARRKLLDQVEQRRRENYRRYYAKLKTTSRFSA